jgi:hypothetical protein
MRLLRLALLQFGVLLAATTVSVTPAQAGGWAVTVLDPLPTRVESGPAYTVGYWVLQHGSHPFEGTLGKTALEFVDQHGKTLTFPGVALPQPAHFAAAVALPHDGTWRMSAIQGIFQDYEIGTLTVPGKLAVNRPPMPMTENYKWGAIHPPDVAKMAAAPAANPASAPATSPAAVASARRPAAESGSTPWLLPLLIALGVAGAGLALALGRRRIPVLLTAVHLRRP